jgi:hypothetical protein
MITEAFFENLKDFHVYYTVLPADQLTPVQTLNGSMDQVNQYINQHGRNILQWPNHAQNEIARLMWVNWIAGNLKVEPVRKPVLVHQVKDQLIVDCGDTRIMSATLHDKKTSLPVILTCRSDSASAYQSWTRILSNRQLFEILNFDHTNAKILVQHTSSNSDHAFSWMEISDNSTSHHWHNEDERLKVMQHHLEQQPNNFYFDMEWALTAVDWNALR